MKPIARLAAALLLCAMLLCTGCAWVGDKLNGLAGESEPPVTEPPGAGLETPVPSGSGSGAYGAENPVFALYSGFLKAERQAFSGLYEAVFASGDAELSSLFLRLLSETAALSEVCSALSLLPEADNSAADAFSGETAGSGAGSGRISKQGEFEFAFANGRKASGSLIEGGKGLELKYGGAVMLLELSPDGCAIRSDRGGECLIAVMDPGGVSAALTPGGLEQAGIPAFDELPEGAQKLIFREGRLE